MIAFDHVNVVVPPGRTEAVVPFYALLGLVRVPKHGSRAEGAWFDLPGGQQVHVSERAGERHPEQHFALRSDDLDALVARLVAAGHPWREVPPSQGRRRGMTADPEGNAVELQDS
ncbi:MAG: glyoxalase [Frankiales bacterium]|nr:glyoxalase [Frankiales bacterium]